MCFHLLAPFYSFNALTYDSWGVLRATIYWRLTLQYLRPLGLVIRAVACFNRVLHLVLCHIHSSLSSPLQISASAADLIDAVIHAVSNIASQFLSRLRRKEQSKRCAYSRPYSKSCYRSWNLFSVHRQSLSTAVILHFSNS
jgi:hypothetical protein